MVASVTLAPLAANAGPYAVRLRWAPSTDPNVVGYHVFVQNGAGNLTFALDAGRPTPAADGSLGASIGGLAPCMTHGFAVTAYRSDGTESAPSNELTLTYATAARFVDSDHDGLKNIQEDKNLDCIVEPGETDPDKPDTDGDGVGDRFDLCQGTAPGAAVNSAGCSCAQILCDDGDVCNGAEVCVAGMCLPGVPLVCDDGNACTTDTCDRLTGCHSTPIPGCGGCTTAAQCDDGNRCTADTCVSGHCLHAALADGVSCEDGLFCDGAEVCRAGACAPGVPVVCDDGNACTTDVCDESRRACTHTAVSGCCTADAQCAPSDACHTNARCTANRCTDDPVVCPAGGECATATCDPRTGCGTTSLPDGTPCDDGNVCTTNDVCTAGTCAGTAPATAALATEALATAADGTTRLTVHTTTTGLTLGATSTFSVRDGLALTATDVHVLLVDDSGTTRFETTVPGSRFVDDGTRAVYFDDHRLEGGGFTSIEFRRRAARVAMSVRAAVVDGGAATRADAQAAAEPPRSATIEWTVNTGSQCVTGSGQCKGRGQRCR